jgi:hypothetical protein
VCAACCSCHQLFQAKAKADADAKAKASAEAEVSHGIRSGWSTGGWTFNSKAQGCKQTLSDDTSTATTHRMLLCVQHSDQAPSDTSLTPGIQATALSESQALLPAVGIHTEKIDVSLLLCCQAKAKAVVKPQAEVKVVTEAAAEVRHSRAVVRNQLTKSQSSRCEQTLVTGVC